jgi:hypothetical protein
MRIRSIIEDIIAIPIGIFVGLIIAWLVPILCDDIIKYGAEAYQFAEDFEDIVELEQPLYYFNFDPTTMIYVTPESYDYIKAMWGVKDDE